MSQGTNRSPDESCEKIMEKVLYPIAISLLIARVMKKSKQHSIFLNRISVEKNVLVRKMTQVVIQAPSYHHFQFFFLKMETEPTKIATINKTFFFFNPVSVKQ